MPPVKHSAPVAGSDQPSVPSRARRAIERTLLRISGRKYVRTRYGVTMRANWGDPTFNYCYFGAYGNALANFLSAIDHEFVFLDVGANQGLYSLLAARNPNCVRAFAFEPVSDTYALLRANIAANHAEQRIEPDDAAISSSSGTAEIVLHQKHSGRASLRRGDAFAPQTETIRTVSIAEVDGRLPDGVEVIAKIDVEGHEDVVIPELTRSRHIERVFAVFYEMDEDLNDPGALRSSLERAGFVEFRQAGSGRHYDVLALRRGVSAVR